MKSQIDWIPLTVGRSGPRRVRRRRGCWLAAIAVIQHGEPDARAWTLDADAARPEPVVGGQRIYGVRRRGADEAVGVFFSSLTVHHRDRSFFCNPILKFQGGGYIRIEDQFHVGRVTRIEFLVQIISSFRSRSSRRPPDFRSRTRVSS